MTYLFQKIMVNGRRLPSKAANDIVYISDTTDIFGDRRDALRDEWINTVSVQIHPKHIVTFRKAAEGLVVVKDVHRRATAITQSVGRPRTPAQLADIVRLLVGTVFVET